MKSLIDVLENKKRTTGEHREIFLERVRLLFLCSLLASNCFQCRQQEPRWWSQLLSCSQVCVCLHSCRPGTAPSASQDSCFSCGFLPSLSLLTKHMDLFFKLYLHKGKQGSLCERKRWLEIHFVCHLYLTFKCIS